MRFTGRSEGDLGHGGEYVHEVRADVESRRRAVLDRPWSWVRQVHSDGVVVVAGPGEGAGATADASVTTHAGAALAVLTADCAPIALAAPEGIVGVVHAGWRGLVVGVIERCIETMHALGASNVLAALGPCIHPECYEFSPQHLEQMAMTLGEHVRARTSEGRPALDLPAGVRAVLRSAGADLAYDADTCTACEAQRFYSHRARQERERQAAVIWLPEALG